MTIDDVWRITHSVRDTASVDGAIISAPASPPVDIPQSRETAANDEETILSVEPKKPVMVTCGAYTGTYDVKKAKESVANISDVICQGYPIEDVFLVMAKHVEIITGDHNIFALAEMYWHELQEKNRV